MTLTNDTLSENSADEGGGIDNESGTVTLTNDTLSENQASGGVGGGISNSGTVKLTTTPSPETPPEGQRRRH